MLLDKKETSNLINNMKISDIITNRMDIWNTFLEEPKMKYNLKTIMET